MDVFATRHQNLKNLVDRLIEPGRTKKEAAVALDMSASFLSQLLAGKRMGDDVARKIEVATGLSHGWMDTPHAEGQAREQPRPSQPQRPDGETLAAAISLVRKACDNLGVNFNPEDAEDAQIVLLGCDYLIERKEREVTVDNLVDFTKRLRQISKDEQSDERRQDIGRTGAGPRRESATRKAG